SARPTVSRSHAPGDVRRSVTRSGFAATRRSSSAMSPSSIAVTASRKRSSSTEPDSRSIRQAGVMSRYLRILRTVKRKPGALLPLEADICAAARRVRREFHGFELAKSLADRSDTTRPSAVRSRQLTAYGTLYRALARLEEMGLLTSRWEDPR